MQGAMLLPGDPAPWFTAAAAGGRHFSLGGAAGRYVVLCFFGSAAAPEAAAALQAVLDHQGMFDDAFAAFVGVSGDPEDDRSGRFARMLPGVRCVWDFDRAVARLYGVAEDAEVSGPRWIVLDPMLRALASFPLDRAGEVMRLLAGLPPVGSHAGAEVPAPVLVLPRVFEPEFCRTLIGLYDAGGGMESGFMRDVDGRTVQVMDHGHKRRSDHVIRDEAIREAARIRMARRVVPEIRKVFQFAATRMERYVVGCYDGAVQGHFRPHRDNTTRGTAHRRFAVSINLDAQAHEGGDLRFPEFGPRTYRAPTGGAVVFSCSLLHEATPVTAGRRYAFLPFLYDDAAAALREANNGHLGQGVAGYRAAPA